MRAVGSSGLLVTTRDASRICSACTCYEPSFDVRTFRQDEVPHLGNAPTYRQLKWGQSAPVSRPPSILNLAYSRRIGVYQTGLQARWRVLLCSLHASQGYIAFELWAPNDPRLS